MDFYLIKGETMSKHKLQETKNKLELLLKIAKIACEENRLLLLCGS